MRRDAPVPDPARRAAAETANTTSCSFLARDGCARRHAGARDDSIAPQRVHGSKRTALMVAKKIVGAVLACIVLASSAPTLATATKPPQATAAKQPPSRSRTADST